MKTTKTPKPQRLGTANDRKAREEEICTGLEFMRREHPDSFDRMLRVLARLMVSESMAKK